MLWFEAPPTTVHEAVWGLCCSLPNLILSKYKTLFGFALKLKMKLEVECWAGARFPADLYTWGCIQFIMRLSGAIFIFPLAFEELPAVPVSTLHLLDWYVWLIKHFQTIRTTKEMGSLLLQMPRKISVCKLWSDKENTPIYPWANRWDLLSLPSSNYLLVFCS